MLPGFVGKCSSEVSNSGLYQEHGLQKYSKYIINNRLQLTRSVLFLDQGWVAKQSAYLSTLYRGNPHSACPSVLYKPASIFLSPVLEVRCFYISCFSLGPHNIDFFLLVFIIPTYDIAPFPPHYPLHCHCKGKRTEKKVMTKPQGFNLKFLPLWLFEAA